jgi:hypothetical protein
VTESAATTSCSRRSSRHNPRRLSPFKPSLQLVLGNSEHSSECIIEVLHFGRLADVPRGGTARSLKESFKLVGLVLLGHALYHSSIRTPHECRQHRRLYLQNLLCYGGDSAGGRSLGSARGRSRLRSVEIGSYDNPSFQAVPEFKLRPCPKTPYPA